MICTCQATPGLPGNPTSTPLTRSICARNLTELLKLSNELNYEESHINAQLGGLPVAWCRLVPAAVAWLLLVKVPWLR